MLKVLAFFALATFIVSFDLEACSITPDPPARKFQGSKAVILAVPKGNSIKPAEAKHPEYRGPLQQTIMWQVLVSWKGTYKPGGTFTTRKNMEMGEGGPIARLWLPQRHYAHTSSSRTGKRHCVRAFIYQIARLAGWALLRQLLRELGYTCGERRTADQVGDEGSKASRWRRMAASVSTPHRQ